MGTSSSTFELSRREKILRSQKTTSAATMNLLTRMVALLSMVCLAASFPQATSNQVEKPYKVNIEGVEVTLLETFPELPDGHEELSPADICDGYSCTGLTFKIKDRQIGEKDVEIHFNCAMHSLQCSCT